MHLHTVGGLVWAKALAVAGQIQQRRNHLKYTSATGAKLLQILLRIL